MIALKIDTKFEGKLACASKNWHEKCGKFPPDHVKVSKLGLWWHPLSKVENVWAENLQESYVSWQWRTMQKLKRNWLVSSKLTWGIWRILTQALENLKNLHFNRLLLTKVYVWAKKIIEKLCLVALNTDAKFEAKITCAFKNDMRNLVNIHLTTFENLKIGTFMGTFYPK